MSGTAPIASATPSTLPQAATTAALGQLLAHQAIRAGPERHAHAQLALTLQRPRQQQVRQVQAGDEQQEAGGARERQHRVAGPVRHLVAQADDGGAGAGVGLGVRPGKVRGHGIQPGPRLLDRHAGREPPDHAQERVGSVLVIGGLERQGSPELGVAIREVKGRRHHPDDHVGRLVEDDGAPEHAGIAAGQPLPQ